MQKYTSNLQRPCVRAWKHLPRTIYVCPACRTLSSTTARRQDSRPFRTRLRAALRDTKVQWRPIPVGLGIASVGALQFYRVQARERRRRDEEHDEEQDHVDETSKHRPKKRKRIKPSGPWQVQIMSTLPLKGVSRLWGRFNELEIPYYLRVPGFKLYSFLFGVKRVYALDISISC